MLQEGVELFPKIVKCEVTQKYEPFRHLRTEYFLFAFDKLEPNYLNAKSYGSRHGISAISAKKGKVRYIMIKVNLYCGVLSR